MNARCPHCGGEHDLDALEPSLKRPDAYLAVPPAERDFRIMGSADACAVRTADDRERRYFLRVLLPFTVIGHELPYSWGVWVEVSEADYHRSHELWDDPDQGNTPPFPGRLASGLHCYRNTLGLPGLASRTGPKHVPHFHFIQGVDHPLAAAQRTAVPAEVAILWILPIYHPETFGKVDAA